MHAVTWHRKSLLVLGLAMGFTVGLSPTTFRIAAALVLYRVLLLVTAIGHSPTLKRRITALESGGPTSAEYARLNRRDQVSSGVLILVVLAIVFLMVVKPGHRTREGFLLCCD